MTEVKDVIHFYLGCEIQFQETLTFNQEPFIGYDKGGITTLDASLLSMIPDSEASGLTIDFKPLLRPLSSMTEEERLEIQLHDAVWKNILRGELSSIRVYLSIDQFTYLLKNSFDIFNLIPNQALDKTKL